MTARHAVLSAAAAVVFGMGVYLWVEVRASPAATGAAPSRTPAPPPPSTTPPAQRDAIAPEPARPGVRSPEQPQLADHAGARSPGDVAPAGTSNDGHTPDAKLDDVMAEASKAYDRADFDEARQLALKVVAANPGNVKMLRILVSVGCIQNDAAEAQKWFAELKSPFDRGQMRQRCARDYQITLPPDPPR